MKEDLSASESGLTRQDTDDVKTQETRKTTHTDKEEEDNCEPSHGDNEDNSECTIGYTDDRDADRQEDDVMNSVSAMPKSYSPAQSNAVPEARSKYFVRSGGLAESNGELGGGKKMAQKVHCSVPLNDVKCSITNKCFVDVKVQKHFQSEVKAKIYSQPKKQTLKIMPKLGTLESKRQRVSQLKKNFGKVDEEHFVTKKTEIDDLDLSRIPLPIRSSTPTPSETTIMAGSLEATQLEKDMPQTLLEMGVTEEQSKNMKETELLKQQKIEEDRKKALEEKKKATDKFLESSDAEPSSQDSDPLGVFVPFMPKDMKSKYLDKVEEARQKKKRNITPEEHCIEWMGENSGICTNNGEEAPSLYAPSVKLSDSILDVTSVSRNVCQPKQGMLNTTFKVMNNVQFM